jgi:hypothetical protein
MCLHGRMESCWNEKQLQLFRVFVGDNLTIAGAFGLDDGTLYVFFAP